MILKGVLKSYDDTTHRATVQVLGSLTSWLADVPVSHALMATDMVAGRYVAVLTPDPAKPGDSVVVALWAATTPPTAPPAFHALDPTQDYRIWRMMNVGSTPRTATVQSVSGDVITLTASDGFKFFDSYMENIVYVKIANTSRGEYAWVKAIPAANQLQVVTAADIASWINGNTISTAYDGAASNKTEVDLSPLLGTTDRGVVFLTVNVRDTGAAAKYSAVYNDGAAATVQLTQFTQAANVNCYNSGPAALATGNRLFIRDNAAGAATLNTIIVATAYTD